MPGAITAEMFMLMRRFSFNPSDVRKMQRWAAKEEELSQGIAVFMEDWFFDEMEQITNDCFNLKQEPDGTSWQPSIDPPTMVKSGTLGLSVGPQGGGKSFVLWGIDASAVDPETGRFAADYGILNNDGTAHAPARRFLVDGGDTEFFDRLGEATLDKMRDLNPVPR